MPVKQTRLVSGPDLGALMFHGHASQNAERRDQLNSFIAAMAEHRAQGMAAVPAVAHMAFNGTAHLQKRR